MSARAPLLVALIASGALASTADARPPRKRVAPPAAAAPPEDDAARRKADAQRLVAEGRDLFDKGNHAGAITRFEGAWRLFPVPKMLYNLGITNQMLKRDDRAACALERFVAEAPDADPALLADARARAARLAPGLGRIEVLTPSQTTLQLDGDAQESPPPYPLCALPGRHRLSAVASGTMPVDLDINVRPGAVMKVTLDPMARTARVLSDAAPAPPAVTTAPAPASSPPAAATGTPVYKKWWLWTVVGVVAVGAGTAAVAATRPSDVTPPPADYGPFRVFQ